MPCRPLTLRPQYCPDHRSQVLEQSAEADNANPAKKIKLDEVAIHDILWHPPAYNSTLKALSNGDYVALLQHVLDLEKNVMIVRNLGSLEPLFTLSADKLRRTAGRSDAHVNIDRFVEAGTATYFAIILGHFSRISQLVCHSTRAVFRFPHRTDPHWMRIGACNPMP